MRLPTQAKWVDPDRLLFFPQAPCKGQPYTPGDFPRLVFSAPGTPPFCAGLLRGLAGPGFGSAFF